MSRSKSGEPGPTEYCFECRARVRYEIAHVHKRSAPDDCPEEYTLATCSVCGEPTLFYRQETDLQREALEIDLPEFHRLYPVLPRTLTCDLPLLVEESYLEACEAELMHLPMASAVMIGRALEATCKIFDPEAKGITDGLRRMRDSGALSQELFEWASEL